MTIDTLERGAKHTCPRCQTRFYDLRRPQTLCPRCGADPVAEAAAMRAARPSRKKAAPKVAPPPKPVEVDDADLPEVEEADDADEDEDDDA
jgi:uncharacterized protein (TIGR02300 family)